MPRSENDFYFRCSVLHLRDLSLQKFNLALENVSFASGKIMNKWIELLLPPGELT
jgi:hypothetical protein